MLNAESQKISADWFSRPVDSILSLIKRRKVAVEDFAALLDGGMATLRELSIGTRAIDEPLAVAIAATVGGSASFWLKRQENYEKALERTLGAAINELDEWLEHVPSPVAQPRGRLSADLTINKTACSVPDFSESINGCYELLWMQENVSVAPVVVDRQLSEASIEFGASKPLLTPS